MVIWTYRDISTCILCPYDPFDSARVQANTQSIKYISPPTSNFHLILHSINYVFIIASILKKITEITGDQTIISTS